MWKPAGCLLLFTFCLSASTIIVSVPKGTGSLQIGGSIDQYLYSDFVIPSDTTYSNVFIDAWITGADPVTAYLTTSVGAGAKNFTAPVTLTPLDQINNGIAEPTIFTNLTLPTGTYYLVLGPGNTTCCDDWFNGTTPVVKAPGVTVAAAITNNVIDSSPGAQNPAYPPASKFSSNNLVAIDVIAAPEASTFLLTLCGMAGAFLWFARTRRSAGR